MPTTIIQGFEKLRQNLEITDLQATTVSTSQQNVRSAIKSEINILDSFLAGSYRRNTMIAPMSEADVDVFIILHPDYYEQNGQALLLDKIKRILRKTYPKTPEISRNGQAITIAFTDFQVDVVPVFYRNGGGFLIPDSILQRWIATDPKIHVEIWSKSNKDHNGDLVPLIKMIKGWNKQHSGLLRSFHLETLILQILNNVTISNYPSGVRYVFDKARLQVQYAVIDPAGYGGNVSAYLDTVSKIQNVVSSMETAYNRAVEAERLALENKTKEAYDKWRLIWGDYFPAYG